MLYIHGRAMDFSPLLVMNLGMLANLLDKKEVDPPMFCNLMNFLCTYMMQNMMVPGTVEKWISLTNIN